MFIRYPSKRAEIPLRHLVPNVITATALCCGLAAIHASLRLEFKDALLFVAASAIFDALDGRAARLLRATSSFGSVLDSLSDFLSFGIAPAIIIYQWMLDNKMLQSEDWLALIPCMLFALCSALRLARFTAAAHAPKHPHAPAGAAHANGSPVVAAMASNFFVGIPTPAAAGVVLIPVLVSASQVGMKYALITPKWVVFAFTIFVALFMVSRQPMFSFKKVRVSRASVVPLLVAVGLVIVGIRLDILLTIATLAGLYLLTFPLALIKHHKLAQQARAEHAEVPEAQPSQA